VKIRPASDFHPQLNLTTAEPRTFVCLEEDFCPHRSAPGEEILTEMDNFGVQQIRHPGEPFAEVSRTHHAPAVFSGRPAAASLLTC
jgi:hypothetical protein